MNLEGPPLQFLASSNPMKTWEIFAVLEHEGFTAYWREMLTLLVVNSAAASTKR